MVNKTTYIYVSIITSLLIGFFTISISLSIFGMTEITKLSNNIKSDCGDTNCTVNVVAGVCFAKITALTDDGIYPIKVECDKKRKGTYEITLPCDITGSGKPKIKCQKTNHSYEAGFWILAAVIIISGITCSITALVCVASIAGIKEKIEEEREEKLEKEREEKNRIKKQKIENDAKILRTRPAKITQKLYPNSTTSTNQPDEKNDKKGLIQDVQIELNSPISSLYPTDYTNTG